jgi:hypothetical protein
MLPVVIAMDGDLRALPTEAFVAWVCGTLALCYLSEIYFGAEFATSKGRNRRWGLLALAWGVGWILLWNLEDRRAP